jgi:hypothetical protein
MKYLCLIFDEEKTLATMPKSQIDALMDEQAVRGAWVRGAWFVVGGSWEPPTTNHQRPTANYLAGAGCG